MPTSVPGLDTIIIVMMVNRSFDHLAGYLSLPGGRTDVEGIGDAAWRQAHANPGTHGPVVPFVLRPLGMDDPPHDRRSVALQIGAEPGGPGLLKGFVQSYATASPADETLVMGFYQAAQVPMVDFFAREFCVCDGWFSPLPTGTQPNRMMAMSGEAPLEDNAPLLLPHRPLVYDWLCNLNVSWRVYFDGQLPFFALMPAWSGAIAKGLALDVLGIHTEFRRYERFARDWAKDPTLPTVIFIEPDYTDGPQFEPNDDHPPTTIDRGQALLRSIYATLLTRPDRWARTLMVVAYDEHGGFFDHVPPRSIVTEPPPGCSYPHGAFETTGIRVPAFLVSPLVPRGRPFHEPLDHTSILAFLAECFTPGRPYSDAVAQRARHLSRLTRALTPGQARTHLPLAPPVATVPRPTTGIVIDAPTDNATAMREAARSLVNTEPLAAVELLPAVAPFAGGEAP
jgi:phospholipase C